MKLSGEKNSYASRFLKPIMCGKKEEKDQQKAEKHKLNEGHKSAFERCTLVYQIEVPALMQNLDSEVGDMESFLTCCSKLKY